MRAAVDDPAFIGCFVCQLPPFPYAAYPILRHGTPGFDLDGEHSISALDEKIYLHAGVASPEAEGPMLRAYMNKFNLDPAMFAPKK